MSSKLTGKVTALSDLLCQRDENFDDLCRSLMSGDKKDLQKMAIKMEELELPAKGILSKLLHSRRINDLSKKILKALENNEESFESLLVLIDSLVSGKGRRKKLINSIDSLSQLIGENPDIETFSAVLSRYSSNGINYKDVENCSLSHLLESGKAMPVIICALLIALGKRKGLKFAGVGLPGHFIAVHVQNNGKLYYMDPASGSLGEITERQIRRLVNSYGYEYKIEMLEPVSDVEVLIRIMNNLYRIWGEQNSDLCLRAAGDILQKLKGV